MFGKPGYTNTRRFNEEIYIYAKDSKAEKSLDFLNMQHRIVVWLANFFYPVLLYPVVGNVTKILSLWTSHWCTYLKL